MTNRERSIEELRKGFQEADSGGGNFEGGDKAFYPFFNIDVGESCSLRLLPDKDENNIFPFVEKQTYQWEFANPENPAETLVVNIPCIEMWNGVHSCPMADTMRPHFKAKTNLDVVRPLWINRDYIYQGFVRSSPLQEENPPENPIRILVLRKRIHEKIKMSILDTDPNTKLEVNPTSFENGLDFIVKKTKNDGGHNDYHTASNWARSPSPLTDEELAAIEKYDLWDLKSRWPAKPTDDQYAVAQQIFEAAYNGEPWNPEWAETWKPYVKKAGGGNAQSHSSGGTGGARQRMQRATIDDEDDTPTRTNETVFEQAEEQAAEQAASAPEVDAPAAASEDKVKDTVAALRRRKAAAAKASA